MLDHEDRNSRGYGRFAQSIGRPSTFQYTETTMISSQRELCDLRGVGRLIDLKFLASSFAGRSFVASHLGPARTSATYQ